MLRTLRLPLFCLFMASAVAAGSMVTASARDRAAAEQAKAERALRAQERRQKQADRAPMTFRVGPGEQFTKPSDVVRSVRSGDTVTISPGIYEDCAVWPRRIRGLVIEGKGATITGPSCAGKGLFVVLASDVIIRGLTFEGAKVPDHNGAGIRAQGTNLTVEDSRFINNENGILASGNPNGSIIVQGSYFEGNGSCEGACAHGIYIGPVKSLRVVQSTFVGQHHGHHIKSRAATTIISNSDIKDGPNGDASYLIDIPNGGTVSIRGNRMQKGPHAENTGSAIMIGEDRDKRDGLHPSEGVTIENNRFANDLRVRTNFVRSFVETPVTLANNELTGNVMPLVTVPKK